MVSHEITFYLAAVVLLVLTAESCIRLLNRDSFGITVGVYVTVFAWYFVDPFINPASYDYLPSSLLGESYGEVLLFLIGFRVFTPAAIRWIGRQRSSGIFATRLTPEQILRGVAAIWLLLFLIGIYRMDGDVMGAVFPLDSRAGMTMWAREAVSSSGSGFLVASGAYLFNAVTAFLGVLIFFQRSIAWRLLAGEMFAITLLYFFNMYLETGGTSPAYGARYLNELLNFVPRVIWPSKPMIGIDYAKWRGFESEDGELGVNTTVSTGMIGGVVLNFGQILGPVAAGILM